MVVHISIAIFGESSSGGISFRCVVELTVTAEVAADLFNFDLTVH